MELVRKQSSKSDCNIGKETNPAASENLSFGVSHGTNARTGAAVFQMNADRYRHTAIIGRTGSGKSNHVQQMEREDIRNGAGVFILAAHSDDALYALSCIPEERLKDVVLVDATNPDYLPRMNPLDVDVTDPSAVSKAVSDVRELLEDDFPAEWVGPRFESMLRAGLSLILEEGFPFPREIAELHRLYNDPERVKESLRYCSDINVFNHWTKVEPAARCSSEYGEVVHWFLSKVSRIANDHVLSHVFGAGRSTIDVTDVINKGKIMICYVPEERIGSSAAHTLGKWLIMQLRDAILTRHGSTGGDGWSGLDYGFYEGLGDGGEGCDLDPFFVYVDEFSRFATDDFCRLLAESRKHNVGFTLSFQTLSQTRAYNRREKTVGGLEEAILGNVGTMVCYPVGARDAELLAAQFDEEPSSLRSIRRYRPRARVMVDNEASRLITLSVERRPDPDNPSVGMRIAVLQVLDGTWEKIGGGSSE